MWLGDSIDPNISVWKGIPGEHNCDGPQAVYPGRGLVQCGLGTEGMVCEHEASRSFCVPSVAFANQGIKDSVGFLPPTIEKLPGGQPAWMEPYSFLYF